MYDRVFFTWKGILKHAVSWGRKEFAIPMAEENLFALGGSNPKCLTLYLQIQTPPWISKF